MKFAFYEDISGEEEQLKEVDKCGLSKKSLLIIIMASFALTAAALLLTLASCWPPSLSSSVNTNGAQLLQLSHGAPSKQTANSNQSQQLPLKAASSNQTTTITVQPPNKFFTASPTSFHNKPPKALPASTLAALEPFETKSRELLKSLKAAVYDEESNKRKAFIQARANDGNNLSPDRAEQSGQLNSTMRISPTIKRSIGERNNSTLGSNFGELASDSLFRPSFLKGLLGDKKKAASDSSSSKSSSSSSSTSNDDEEDDDEEEVTQTIVMPIKQHLNDQQQQQQQQQQHAVNQATRPPGIKGNEDFQTNPTSLYSSHATNRHMSHPGFGHMGHAHHVPQRGVNAAQAAQLRSEASFRLSNQEINGILNDREAPEMYKEREVLGDGVMVGEEPTGINQQRLGTAASTIGGHGPYTSASNQFGPYNGGFPMSYGNQAFNNRLMQSPSEDPSSGFNHRFGQGYMGGYNDHMGGSGRLMQSPNEFNEMSYHNGAGYGGAGYTNDYSPNSGLLRAGSGDYYGGSGGGGMGGPSFDNMGGGFGSLGAHRLGMGGSSHMGVNHMSGGYPDSPMLDRHASEIYGGGADGYQGGLGYVSGYYSNQRLYAAGSHHPSSSLHGASSSSSSGSGVGGGRLGGAAQSSFGAGADYNSRYGYGPTAAGSYNYGRGFSTHNNMMMRGNSMMTNTMQDQAGGFRMTREASAGPAYPAAAPIGPDGTRLLPLTPVVPVAEDLGPNYQAAANQDHKSAMKSDLHHHHHHQQQAHPQVHEGLDDDPNDASEVADTTPTSSVEPHSMGGFDSGLMDGSMSMGHAMGPSMGPGMGMGGENQQVVSDETTTASVHDSYQARTSTRSNNNNEPHKSLVVRPAAEFSRIGSAGYVPPHLSTQQLNQNRGQAQSSNASPQPSYRLKQKFLKKASSLLHPRGDNNHPNDQRHPSTTSSSNYDPAENPAHAVPPEQ